MLGLLAIIASTKLVQSWYDMVYGKGVVGEAVKVEEGLYTRAKESACGIGPASACSPVAVWPEMTL